MSFEIGSVLPFQFTVTDAAGALTNASSITVTVTAPDGTTSTPSTANPSTGVYTADVSATMAGLWFATAATTSPTDVSPAQTFYVEALASTVTLVSLDEAKDYLRVTNTSQDEKLRSRLVAATRAVEAYTGQVWVRKSFTETYSGGSPAIVLRRSPVRSITSVTESGSAVAATGYTLSDVAPVLYRGASTLPLTWLPGNHNISVTYVAGPQEIPATVREACLIVVRALWNSQRGGGDLPAAAELEYASPGDVIPREARVMLDPYMRAGIG